MSKSFTNERSCKRCIVCGLIVTEAFKCSKCKGNLHIKCAFPITKKDGKQSKLCNKCYIEDEGKF